MSSRLQQFPVAEGKSGPQIIELLSKRVLALGAIQSGSFIVDCETYSSVVSLGESFNKLFILPYQNVITIQYYSLYKYIGIALLKAISIFFPFYSTRSSVLSARWR